MGHEEQVLARRREEKIADFALGGLLTAIQGGMGQSMPVEENARDLVRLGRTVFSEIDHPTEPPEPDEETAPPGGASEPPDWRDHLYADEEGL